ncbi:hypothetical protein E2C01_088814 [Portunus trituberculatus]|uniref:Uncharacterized protein n=1 Tax=Portunus trituberculatus TaxID=210409 RepID=A0A5B7JHH7_PORTR|nr:hypothetical protein [Portunus trituberculatus]
MYKECEREFNPSTVQHQSPKLHKAETVIAHFYNILHQPGGLQHRQPYNVATTRSNTSNSCSYYSPPLHTLHRPTPAPPLNCLPARHTAIFTCFTTAHFQPPLLPSRLWTMERCQVNRPPYVGKRPAFYRMKGNNRKRKGEEPLGGVNKDLTHCHKKP